MISDPDGKIIHHGTSVRLPLQHPFIKHPIRAIQNDTAAGMVKISSSFTRLMRFIAENNDTAVIEPRIPPNMLSPFICNVYHGLSGPYESGFAATFQIRAPARNAMHITDNNKMVPAADSPVLRKGRQLIAAPVIAAMIAIRVYVATVSPKNVSSRIMVFVVTRGLFQVLQDWSRTNVQ